MNQYRGGRRTLLNLATALQDGGAWGRDAGVFKVRNRATYEKLGVGFAEQAVNESIANGGMDRKCPAKQLALLLGKVFLSVFEKEDWFVSVGETGFQMRTGGLYTPGMTLLYARNETNCLESKCKCGLSKMGSAKEDNGRVCQWTKRFCNNCLKMNNYCRFM